jgi:chromosome partitioning protein
MVVVLGGIQDGSGKTTVATNLAVLRAAAGFDVLLVDADERESSYSFAQVRNETHKNDSLRCVKLTGTPVGCQVRNLAAKYHDIVIDAGSGNLATQRAALGVADIALLPFKPQSIDVWTLGRLSQVIEDARGVNGKVHAAAFLNMVDYGSTGSSDVPDLLKETGSFVFSGILIGRRKAFGTAAVDGLAVSELRPVDTEANQEIKSLYSYVFATTHIHEIYVEALVSI